MRTALRWLAAFACIALLALLVFFSAAIWEPSVDCARALSVALQALGLYGVVWRVRLRILLMAKFPSLESIRQLIDQRLHELANRAKGLSSVERDITLRWDIDGDRLSAALAQFDAENKKKIEAARSEWWIEFASASLVLAGVIVGTWTDWISVHWKLFFGW